MGTGPGRSRMLSLAGRTPRMNKQACSFAGRLIRWKWLETKCTQLVMKALCSMRLQRNSKQEAQTKMENLV